MFAAQVSNPIRLGPSAGSIQLADMGRDGFSTLVLPFGAEAIKGQELGTDYYEAAVPVVEIQIARAGYRLATWLDMIVSQINRRRDMQDL